MMKLLLKRALLVTLFGSAIFLLSCTDDEGTVLEVTASYTFEVTAGSGQVVFDNNSINADDYVWEFDDGNTSTAENPTHTYSASGNYDVTLTASNDTDSDSNTQQVTISITVDPTDTTVPVIELTGDSPLCLTEGDTYTDPGASATDDVDGDITASIVVGGDNVDTSTPGEYTVTYDVIDAANNAAAQVERVVIVSAAFSVEGNLVANADFSNTVIDGNPWYANYENGPEIRTEGCSSFFFAEIAAGASNSEQPFVVNISQVIGDAAPGNSYELAFNASSDRSRTIIAGIGLTGGASGTNFQNVSETVAITDADARYTITVNTNGFEENADIRILFDLAGEEGTVVIDNVSLVEVEVTSIAPTTAPAAPTQNEADVISIYSDSYTDVTNTGFNLYGAATFNEVEDLNGNSVLQYTLSGETGGNFQVIELGDANKFDASGMTNFRFDAWFSNEVGTGASFIMKVVNFDGEPNEEATLTITTASTPALAQGAWLSYDISLTELANLGLTATSAIQQVVVDVANVGEVYLDNIYFYNDPNGGGSGSGGCTETPVAATALPLDFEGCETFLSTFNNDGSITTALAANPSVGGVNTSANALKVDKAAGTNRWAGFQNSFANPLDFTNKVLKAKIYSSKANTVFRFELALDPQTDPVTGNPAPQFATVANANEWTEVEVEFSNFPATAATYNQLVIKPDNPDGSDGELTATAETYYFDDLSIGDAEVTSTPGVYCDTQVTHFGGNAGSEALLTIESFDRVDNFPALKFTIKTDPTNGKAPDVIIVNSMEGGNGLELADTSVDGEISVVAFWPSGSPPNDETLFNVLWSFENEDAQWQLFESITDTRVPLDASCAD